MVIFYAIIGLPYCFGNGFYNVILVDSFVNICSIVGALIQPLFFFFFLNIEDFEKKMFISTG